MSQRNESSSLKITVEKVVLGTFRDDQLFARNPETDMTFMDELRMQYAGKGIVDLCISPKHLDEAAMQANSSLERSGFRLREPGAFLHAVIGTQVTVEPVADILRADETTSTN